MSEARKELAALIDRTSGLGEWAYTSPEVAERAGVELEEGRRFWRAMGFPSVGDDVRMFTDEDVEMLQAVKGLLESEVVDPDEALRVARATGQAMSRLADAYVDVLLDRIGRDSVTGGGLDAEAAQRMVELSEAAAPALDHSVLYLWKRHLAAAAKRSLLPPEQDEDVAAAVGFADMVGFSSLSQELDERELQDLVERFEISSFDIVAEQGGRVVKMIGDEVMFTCPDATNAAEIGLSLVERAAEDAALPDVRVGLAYGRTVAMGGDLFGPSVNIASRLAGFAKPNTVVVDDALATELPDAGFEKKPIRRRHHLKGVGKVRMVAVTRAGDART